MDFKRSPQKFVFTGVDLNNPVDLMPPGKSPYARNLRSYREGQITQRSGLSPIGTSLGNAIHSLCRVNTYSDHVTSTFLRYVGAGDTLYYGTTSSFSSLIGGWSGNPLTFNSYRPDQSVGVWTYITDKNQMKKVQGTNVRNFGIAPPIVAPSAELVRPAYNIPNAFDAGSGWTNHDDAGAVTRADRVNTTILARALVGGSSPGWVCIAPTDMSNIVAGMTIFVNGEQTVVEETNSAQFGGGTIQSIVYDNVTGPGLCTIVPSIPVSNLKRNSLIYVGVAPLEYLRVISVTQGPDGYASIRCSTALTYTTGQDLFFLPSFFCYLNGVTAPTDPILAFEQGFSFSSGGAQTGQVAYNSSYDLSIANSRPIGAADYIHLSLKISDPTKLVEAKLVLDIDPATTGTWDAADGQKNALYRTIRASDFQVVTGYAQTMDEARSEAITTQLQSDTNVAQPSVDPNAPLQSGQNSTSENVPNVANELDALAGLLDGQDTSIPNWVDAGIQDTSTTTNQPVAEQPPGSDQIPAIAPPTAQLATGDEQWTEFRWKVSDLLRVGTDAGSSLATVKAFQIRFSVIDDVDIAIGNLWVGGTYGPDTADIYAPIMYRYRYRASESGAVSNPGPAMRSGILTLRQGVALTFTASSDPQVDKIDYERFGGQANSWHYVGTCPNSSPTATDDQMSAAIIINDGLDPEAFQPFTISDTPKTSQVVVCGTAVVWASGDTFNTSMARGTRVIVNGRPTTLYASPTNNTLLHLQDSMGQAGSATLEIPNPVLAGQPLPVMFGPFYDTYFGLGNPLAPGTIYFTTKGSPERQPDHNFFEITSPSEALMNGCMFDGKAYVWSDRRMFQIIPGANTAQPFEFVEVPSGKGLAAIWGFAVGPKMWWVGTDGIYESVGDTAKLITDDILPMFPQGDRTVGVTTNGIDPVQMAASGSTSQMNYLRLCYHDNFLYFDFQDTSGNFRTWVYSLELEAWFYDQYFSGSNTGMLVRLSENGVYDGDEVNTLLSGSNNGTVYQNSGTLDNSSQISCEFWTPAVDVGDERAKKVYGDVVFDMNTNNVSVTAAAFKDFFQVSLVESKTYSTSSRQVTDPLDLQSGSGVIIRNLGIKLTWSGAGVELYFWEPSTLSRPEDTFLRATDWDDAGYHGSKLVRGFLVEFDSENVARTVKLQGDQADLQTYTMQANGQRLLAFAVEPPQIASLLRLLPTDSGSWRLWPRISYIFDQLPENAAITTSFTDAGLKGAKFVQGMIVKALGTSNATVEYDGGTSGPTVSLSHSGTFPYGKAYSFQTPFIANTLRLVPASNIRLEDVIWIYEPAPELTEYWITQETTHDLSGYMFLRDGYISLVSTATVTLTIVVDGVTHTFSIPSTAGAYVKYYLILGDGTGRNLKGRAFQYSLTSPAGFRLFKKDSEVRVKMTSGGNYVVRQPFGGYSRNDGALV